MSDSEEPNNNELLSNEPEITESPAAPLVYATVVQPPIPPGATPSVTGRGGYWMEFVDIDMCGQGDTEIIPNWTYNFTIDELKRTVEERGYSAITVSNGLPAFGHAALKKFDFQLTHMHCKPISTCCRHPCKIYIYTSTTSGTAAAGSAIPAAVQAPATVISSWPGPSASMPPGATPSVTGRGGYWTEHVDIDMCRQGDVSIIHNWRSVTSIEAMKKTVEEKGFSAITVSNGSPSFAHAGIKRFDFQLKPEHCKPISTCCRHPCKIYIYTSAESARGSKSLAEEVSIEGDYFSFKTGGNPTEVVDRFRAKRSGSTVTFCRNQGHPGGGAQPGSTPCESYTMVGNVLKGPVSATVQPNGDIVYSHGYTSRRIPGSSAAACASAYQPSTPELDKNASKDYFSFRTGGDPSNVVDRFRAVRAGSTWTHYRNQGIPGPHAQPGHVPCESFTIQGNCLTGVVSATIQPNEDIVWSHGYTSRLAGSVVAVEASHVAVVMQDQGIDGDYFSFKTGGSPDGVVDRFRARRSGNTVTYYRSQAHPGPGAQPGHVACESYTMSGNSLKGPVSATIQPNGDIVYSHGYTSRRMDSGTRQFPDGTPVVVGVPVQATMQANGSQGGVQAGYISAEEMAGCWTCLCIPGGCACFEKKAQGPDRLVHKGCVLCFFALPLPFEEPRVRIPGTNDFYKEAEAPGTGDVDRYSSSGCVCNGLSCSMKLW